MSLRRLYRIGSCFWPGHIEHLPTTDIKFISHGASELAAKIAEWASRREADGSLTSLQQSALAIYSTYHAKEICDRS